MNKYILNTQSNLLLITPLFIVLTHYLAVFPHEYMHSFMAWALGFKENPFLINYGGTNWQNLLFLRNIDENVNYLKIYNEGYTYSTAIIAFSGAGIANVLLFALSQYLLNKKNIQQRIYTYYFLFWFNLMNLGNFYDYVPIRTFAKSGDVYIIVTALQISAWLIYILFGYAVCYLMWRFFSKTLIKAYQHLNTTSNIHKATLLSLCTIILFGYFGRVISTLTVPSNLDAISYFLSITSLLMMPIVIIAGWPNRACVQQS